MKSGFILAEDEAIKARFSNFHVSDDRNQLRPVKVFFRYPESETERDYPFITIELIDILHATDRQHSETILYSGDYYQESPAYFDYWPSESASVTGSSSTSYTRAEEFIPIDLLYQVSIYCRSALHDRQLTSRILSHVTPFRFNSIAIPADGTTRRFDLLDWTNADLLDMESGYRKRIFRKVLTLKMSSEMTGLDLASLTSVQPVTSINSTLINQLTVFNQ
jgi:hypothetical protein